MKDHTFFRRGYTFNNSENKKVKELVFKRDNYMCVFCATKENLTIDHKVPTSLGGNNDLDNLITLCNICNSKKHTKINITSQALEKAYNRLRKLKQDIQNINIKQNKPLSYESNYVLDLKDKIQSLEKHNQTMMTLLENEQELTKQAQHNWLWGGGR